VGKGIRGEKKLGKFKPPCLTMGLRGRIGRKKKVKVTALSKESGTGRKKNLGSPKNLHGGVENVVQE